MVESKDEAVTRERRGTDITQIIEHRRHLSAADVDRKQRDMSPVLSGRPECGAVRRPHQTARRSIPIGRQDPDRAIRPPTHHDTQPIRLKARAFHGQVGQCPTIGRECRGRIPGLVVFREISRRCHTKHRRQPQVKIRRPRFSLVDNPRGEYDARTVRGKRKFFGATERNRRGIPINPGHHIYRWTALKRHHEDMRTSTVFPGIPVTNEDAIEQSSTRLCTRLCLETLNSTVQGVALHEHLHGDSEVRTIRGKREIRHVERELGNRCRLSPHCIETPHLGRTGPGGKEVEGFAVRRPARREITGGMGGELLGDPPRTIHHPDVGPPPVRVDVKRADDKRHPPTVWRGLGIGNTVHRHQVESSHGTKGLRSVRCRSQEDQGKNLSSATDHRLNLQLGTDMILCETTGEGNIGVAVW